MPPMSKVDLYAAIRRGARAGLSSRALESKYRVGAAHGDGGVGVGVAEAA